MYLVVASYLDVTVCVVHIPQRSGIEVLVCALGAGANRPAKGRFAVSRQSRVAGFWLPKIERFAGSCHACAW